MAPKPLKVSLSGHEDEPNVVLTMPTTRLRKSAVDRLAKMNASQRGSSETWDVPSFWYERVMKVIKEEYPGWSVMIDDSALICKAEGERLAWGVRREGWGQGDRVGYLPVGVLRKLPVFTISTSYISREAPRARLSSALPGLIGSFGDRHAYIGCDTVEEAKAKAEELLDGWTADFLDAMGLETQP